jgi:hypothetical protein
MERILVFLKSSKHISLYCRVKWLYGVFQQTTRFVGNSNDSIFYHCHMTVTKQQLFIKKRSKKSIAIQSHFLYYNRSIDCSRFVMNHRRRNHKWHSIYFFIFFPCASIFTSRKFPSVFFLFTAAAACLLARQT